MSIIFTDLDGTLLNDDSVISDYTRKILTGYTSAGNNIAFSSGRSLPSVLKVLSDLNLNLPGSYIIATNGTLIYDCDKLETVFESRLTYEEVRKVWQLAKENGVYIQTYTDTSLVIGKRTKETDFYMIRCPHPLLIASDPTNVMDKPPCKLLAIDLEDHEKLVRFSKLVDEGFSSLTTLFSNSRYLEVFPANAGKGEALRLLCDYLGIDIKDSYAFGDEENDISMLRAAGTGVGMCNGNPKIFDYCDIITEFDNNNDGLARYIEKSVK
ncbi:MAG: Cof-type HAD-IIB family hydrolase [Lachnospiraceae bacterium]|nr:Cof-type HAD-IIB family hydrolase [Lachnospiraceae bacterium]